MNRPRSRGWVPSLPQARKELYRERKKRYRSRRRALLLVLLALAAVLGWVVSAQLFQLVRVTGISMQPTLASGSVVLAVRMDSPLIRMLFGTDGLEIAPEEEEESEDSPEPESAPEGMFADAMRRADEFSRWLAEKTAGVREELERGRFSRPEDGVFAVHLSPGEIALFEADGSLLIRRVIAKPGDTVEYTESGLQVNGVRVSHEARRGNRVYPMTVPDRELYVLGDMREWAEDSRSLRFGDVPESAVRGRAVAVVWPLWRAG